MTAHGAGCMQMMGGAATPPLAVNAVVGAAASMVVEMMVELMVAVTAAVMVAVMVLTAAVGVVMVGMIVVAATVMIVWRWRTGAVGVGCQMRRIEPALALMGSQRHSATSAQSRWHRWRQHLQT